MNDYPGFIQSTLASRPCCPMGCDPCASFYYTSNEHHWCCCKGGCCASPQQIKATREWLDKWYKAEEEYLTVQWLTAEKCYEWDVIAWLEAEKQFTQTLTPKAPQVVHKPRKENSPTIKKHVKAMQRHQ